MDRDRRHGDGVRSNVRDRLKTYPGLRVLADQTAAIDEKVGETVEMTLADIERRGDAAVRELSIQFDESGRDSYRLTGTDLRKRLGFGSSTGRSYRHHRP